ncbi:MAG: exodeoxyribonuclease VII small subunit [Deltaproteobacteria bacterium]|nr:exodeoxyribonuclease VII small subunit [Deltaproteobacteria bacterium]MCX7952271.1 exodeoxyribonuclease VII small subunit [Deltaproteobacteria bacterium]
MNEISLAELLENVERVAELDFEQGLSLFEQLITRLSEKDISLAEMVRLYEVGTKLSERLFSQLQEAEEQIRVFRERGEKLVEEIHKAEELIERLKNNQMAR